ncbi:MAG TPA: DMT family transporter [Magnetospirillaceae bacterium]|nr:DMT family transporter [Magnetospirillaceae bacterium]
MTSTLLLTALTMLAFAANSVLCRLALSHTAIDPAGFTLVRIASGAAMLWVLANVFGKRKGIGGSWKGAATLIVYAIAFSLAYVSLPAGTGALLLFGAVQVTMVATGLVQGERLSLGQWAGLAVALAGLITLVAPGVSAPPPLGAALMALSGMFWGIYSLLGRGASDPVVTTAGNFLRAVPMALLPAIILMGQFNPDPMGILYAVLSGTLASGCGYILWYSVLPRLSAAQGASVQLSVPVIAALAGAALMGEALSLRLGIASAAVLGGIALVIAGRRRRL